jgi:hypothetical protein
MGIIAWLAASDVCIAQHLRTFLVAIHRVVGLVASARSQPSSGFAGTVDGATFGSLPVRALSALLRVVTRVGTARR